MKLDSSIQTDLLKLGAMLGSFASRHINDPALKAHISLQSQLVPHLSALKPEGVKTGLSAKEIYGEHKISEGSFNDQKDRQGPIFVANQVGAYTKVNDALDSLDFLNSKLTKMTLSQREQFTQFIEQVAVVSTTNKLPYNFEQAKKLHSILKEDNVQNNENVLKR
jgi:hypothetical protein